MSYSIFGDGVIIDRYRLVLGINNAIVDQTGHNLALESERFERSLYDAADFIIQQYLVCLSDKLRDIVDSFDENRCVYSHVCIETECLH